MGHRKSSSRTALFAMVLAGLVLAGCSKAGETVSEEKKGPASATPTKASEAMAAAAESAADPDVVDLTESPAPAAAEDAGEEWESDVAELPPEVEPTTAGAVALEQLKKLKFKARREVVWARGAIANIPGYEKSLERLKREVKEWGMYERIPEEPLREALQEELDRQGQLNGVTVEYREFQDAKIKRRKLPETIHGQKPFDFEDNDIRNVILVVIRTGLADEAALEKFLSALVRDERLVVVKKVKPRPQQKGWVINLEAYWFPKTSYPLHIVESKVLEDEMKRVGLKLSVDEVVKLDSVGYLQHASMSYREFNASLEELNGAMKLLSESKYMSARAEFFRRKSEDALRSVVKLQLND